MVSIRRFAAVPAVIFSLGLFSAVTHADERPYTEGPVVNVGAIRTEYGKFDDYMKFLSTTWKTEMEAEKKAGLILSYQVMTVEPRAADDPDVYLVITYKNWAALDGLADKSDSIAKQVYGSVSAANQGATDRGKMRRNLGGQTMQILNLK